MAWVWTTQPDKIDFEKARALIREEFAALNMPDDVYPAGFLERWDPNEDFIYDGSVYEDPDEFRDKLLEDLQAVEDAWSGMTDRDELVQDIGPIRILMSGGMSSGDSPSEAFDQINRIPQHVYEAAGFFDDGVAVVFTEPERDAVQRFLLEYVPDADLPNTRESGWEPEDVAALDSAYGKVLATVSQ